LLAPIVEIEPQEIALRLHAIQQQLETVKPLYAERDNLILSLVQQAIREISLPGGITLRILDNFLTSQGQIKNTAFRACGVARFEADFTDQTSAKRAKKGTSK